MLKKGCLNRRFCIQAVIVTFLFGCVVIYYCPMVLKQLSFYKSPYKTDTINLSHLMKQEFYQENCFQGDLELTLNRLHENLLKWSKAYHRKCQILWKKFHTIYRVNVREAKQSFPPPFLREVRHWLGDNDKLLKQVHNQKVIHVNNYYSLEQTVFNLLRSKRPSSETSEGTQEYVDKLDALTRRTCDFCRYKTNTADDIFGRIEGQYSVSASNTFKLEKWHSLFLSKKHSPVDLTEEEFLDLFNTSLKWFKKANSVDEESCYPMMIYDTLPKGGASQFHPHAHGFLASQYLSHMAVQQKAAITYKDENAGGYWNDLIEIHYALGLSVTLGDAVAISPLTPVREHEIIIFSNHPGTDLFRLFYYVIQTYYHKLERMCFSTGLAFPVMCSRSSSDSLPATIRIGTRGQCNSPINDVSSLELYVMQNVHVDPYIIIRDLQETVSKLGRTSSLGNEKMVRLSDD
ncbi:hypothetical protein B7P43_G16122 [Cryptotermes secundus]|uniref:Uncharacterized protein n=1 Tax=Cryptotermes secundus TaxID=105785 RepID=A0A2J7Q5F2_9NEOP|nr:uncharacterized protein LOC111869709 [Cryptotermes secundus]XP_023717193.1 uncharacterized protein LOC111869709 [Cryptotermes secundus]PNF23810.1 hypothetical protein B7P43_G16122 [Cryptotermes secundus]PNF23811.1 hypothetical protein B7P43_G16122 [Cryptotermes secundus]